VDNLTAAVREIAAPPPRDPSEERYFALVIRKDSSGATVTRVIEITKDLATRSWV